jgi:hypothetical protein
VDRGPDHLLIGSHDRLRRRVVGSSGPISGGSYIEFDVTGIVTGDGLVSFALTTDHSTAFRFDSSEGGKAPAHRCESGTDPPVR